MAEGQSDLIYQAELDNKAVLESIKEMRKEAEGFEKQGDKAMAEYGKQVDNTAKQLLTLARALEKGGTSADKAKEGLKKFFETGTTSARQLRGQLTSMLKDIKMVGELKEGDVALDFDKIFGGKIKGKVTREILLKVIGTEEAGQKIEQLRGITDKLMSSTDDSAKLIGTHLRALGEDLYTSFKKGGKGVDEANKELNEFVASAKKAQAQIKSVGETDLEKELKVHKAKAAMKDLDSTISKMAQSTKVEVRSAGVTFQKLRDQIKDAAKDPKADMSALIKKTRELNREAKKLGSAYESKVAGGANKARISAYKLGTTLDRIGVRGAGGVLRIVDSFKGIPKATIAAVAGIAAVGLAFLGLIKIIVRLEKAMVRAFVDITKQAVEVAKTYELTEKQLENVFKGKTDIARHTLDRILDLSVEFGVNLTSEFTKIFLPLVDSFDQFEEIAQQASTLAIGTGKTIEQISKALKQAQAGRFRSLQDQFGVLASDVKIIKRLQDEMGETAGLIEGMQRFFDRTGQNWDTYENTLGRVLGSLDVLKDKLLLTFGEPIKNEITIQLQRVIEWVEKNEEVLRTFLSRIGGMLSDLATKVGDTVTSFLESITIDDLQLIEDTLGDVADAAAQLIEAMVGAGDEKARGGMNFILDAALALLKILEGTLLVVADIVEFMQRMKIISSETSKELSEKYVEAAIGFAEKTGQSNIDALQELLKFGWNQAGFTLGIHPDVTKATRAEIRGMYLALIELGLGGEEAIEVMEEWGFVVDKVKSPVEDLITGLEEEIDALAKSDSALDDNADAILKTNAAYQDFLITQQEYLEQVEEVRQAEEKLVDEMGKRFSEIFKATMASDIDARIAEVGKRIRIEQEKIANLETLEWKIINIDAMDLDTVAQFGRMQIEGLQQDIDSTLDYIVSKRGQMSEEELKRLQMEIDFKRRLIQLEQQHIDKIADLQTKRRDDEADAQTDYDRREETIIIKAARREIEMELDHSRKIERMEQAHQNRLREIRMRADFDAQEAIRMNDAVALLRIRRRMDFDIQMAEEKNNQQKQNANTDAQDRRAKLDRQLQYELEDLERAHEQKLEDIATNFKRQLILIEENYQRQLREQAIQERQKREDMLIWLKTSLDDFKSNWDDKNAAHEEKWKEFYEIEKKYLAMVVEARKVLFESGGMTVGVSPYGGYGAGSILTGGSPGALGTMPAFPNYGAPPTGPTGGTGGGIDQTLKLVVLQVLQRLNATGQISNPQFWLDQINAATTNARLREIKNLLNSIGVGGPPMQHGGLANVGQQYTVGEAGPEQYRPSKAGIIEPAAREYMPTGAPQIQSITTDNSRSVSAPISLLDPTHLSPVQITMIRGIVTEEILKSVV